MYANTTNVCRARRAAPAPCCRSPSNRERQASEGLRAELETAEKTVQLLSSVLQHKGVDLKDYIS
jgi:hypothetical protein